MKKLSHLIIAIIFFDVTSSFCQITTFHGATDERYPAGQMNGNSIARTKEGKYVVGGTIDGDGWHGRPYLLKTSISGTNAWQRMYSVEPRRYEGNVLSVREYGAGTFVATGTISEGGLFHPLFLKIDSHGNTLAMKSFRFYTDDAATCIQVVKNPGAPNGTILTGTANTHGGFVYVTDGNGELLATRLIDNSLTRWVAQMTDGFLVLGGNPENSELHLLKFTSDLKLLWAKA